MIVYLHGFASSARSHKARWLGERLGRADYHVPTYPQEPAAALAWLDGYATGLRAGAGPGEPLLWIGSSLGGWHAQRLARAHGGGVVLINPALDPARTLAPYLGAVRHFHDGTRFTLTREHLAVLARHDVPAPCAQPVPTLLLADAGDEVIDSRDAVARYQGCAEVVVYPGGSHAFEHLEEALPRILDFAARLER